MHYNGLSTKGKDKLGRIKVTVQILMASHGLCVDI